MIDNAESITVETEEEPPPQRPFRLPVDLKMPITLRNEFGEPFNDNILKTLRVSDPEIAVIDDGFIVPTKRKFGIFEVLIDYPPNETRKLLTVEVLP